MFPFWNYFVSQYITNFLKKGNRKDMATKLKMTTTECTAIRRWLKVGDNSPALLAVKLGLKSSTAIAQWLSRGRVSKWHLEKVREICNGVKGV